MPRGHVSFLLLILVLGGCTSQELAMEDYTRVYNNFTFGPGAQGRVVHQVVHHKAKDLEFTGVLTHEAGKEVGGDPELWFFIHPLGTNLWFSAGGRPLTDEGGGGIPQVVFGRWKDLPAVQLQYPGGKTVDLLVQDSRVVAPPEDGGRFQPEPQKDWLAFLPRPVLHRDTIPWIMGFLLGGFGVIVVIMTVIQLVGKAPREEIKKTWIRYLVWFLIVPPFLFPLVYSRELFQGVVFLLSLLSLREYSRITGLWKDKLVMGFNYVAVAAVYVPFVIGDFGFYQAFPVYAAGLVILVPILRGQYEHMIQKTCLSLLGVVYFGWFLSHLAYMRNLPFGAEYVFFLMVLVESGDAFGYIWGKLLGRHKLIPRISPNKTVEGALGSLVSVVVVGMVLSGFFPFMTFAPLLGLLILISVLGLFGDLTISYIKRDLHIKDAGSLIPGHGGLLDRFDSLIFVIPMAFHFLRFFYYGT